MTIAIEFDRRTAVTPYSRPGAWPKARPSVLDVYGRWSIVRGAIADMESETTDDELRSLIAEEAMAMSQMAAIQPRTVDELLSKVEVFLAALAEATVSREVRLLGHAIAVDVREWVATT
jgi:hypothetical protein